MNKYKTDNGEVDWVRVCETLDDVSRSYLMDIQGIKSKRTQTREEALQWLTETDPSDINDDTLARRLQKATQIILQILDIWCTLQKDDKFTFDRLSKFAPVVSKLSDQYAMEDSMYQSQWHNDVIGICDLIVEKNRELNG